MDQFDILLVQFELPILNFHLSPDYLRFYKLIICKPNLPIFIMGEGVMAQIPNQVGDHIKTRIRPFCGSLIEGLYYMSIILTIKNPYAFWCSAIVSFSAFFWAFLYVYEKKFIGKKIDFFLSLDFIIYSVFFIGVTMIGYYCQTTRKRILRPCSWFVTQNIAFNSLI